VFRGSTTGGVYTLENYRQFARTKVVMLSRQYPELIDAGMYVCMYAGRDVEQTIS
jgi:hypothetical protein